MYYYIYDSFLEGKEYQRLLPRIETETNNLGLTGERGQVTTLRKTGELTTEAVRHGYHPIVIVGNDQTLSAAVQAMGQLTSDTPLAYIPMQANQDLAELLGVTLREGVVTLSRRVVRTIPLGCVNDTYFFLGSVLCQPANEKEGSSTGWSERLKSLPNPREATIIIDDRTQAVLQAHELSISHVPERKKFQLKARTLRKRFLGNPEVVEESVLWGSTISIRSREPWVVSLDGRSLVRTPITVTLSNRRIPFIVGRARHFA